MFRDRRRRLLVGTVGAGSLMLGAIDTLIVVLALDVLKTGDAGVGFLNAASGSEPSSVRRLRWSPASVPGSSLGSERG